VVFKYFDVTNMLALHLRFIGDGTDDVGRFYPMLVSDLDPIDLHAGLGTTLRFAGLTFGCGFVGTRVTVAHTLGRGRARLRTLLISNLVSGARRRGIDQQRCVTLGDMRERCRDLDR